MAEIKVAALVGVMTAMAALVVFSSRARRDKGIVAASFKELDDGKKPLSAKRRWIHLSRSFRVRDVRDVRRTRVSDSEEFTGLHGEGQARRRALKKREKGR